MSVEIEDRICAECGHLESKHEGDRRCWHQKMTNGLWTGVQVHDCFCSGFAATQKGQSNDK